MDDYRVTVDIELTDNYKNAKKDLIQTMDSFSKLTPLEKEHLIQELFGATQVAIVMVFYKKFFGE